MTVLATQAVADVRQLSSLFNNNLFSDAQIVNLFNDGASELYDFMVGQFETWFLASVDFTLAGGVGGNVFPMPMDLLLKDNTLELNPTNNVPIPVPRLGTWADRNRGWGPGGYFGTNGGRRYYPAGSNLMVFPPDLAAGNYRLWYTPKYIPISLPYAIPPSVPTVPATINAIGAGGGGLTAISFNGSAWTAASTGDTFIVSNSSNGNDGIYPIFAVNDSADITITGMLTAESGTGVTGIVQPAGTTNAFNVVMEPWVLYPEVHAAIAIRTSRQQDTSDLQPKLAQLKQRIATATANRTEEVPQTPLRDSMNWGGGYFNGGP